MRASRATCHHAGRCNTPGTSPGPAFADTMEIMESSRTFAGAHVGLCAVVMFEFYTEGGQAPYGANTLAVNVGTFVLASWSLVVVVPPTHPSTLGLQDCAPSSHQSWTIHRRRSALGHQSSATLVRPSAPTRGLSRQSLRRESRPRPPREGAPRSLRTKIPETPRSVSSDLGTPNSLEAAHIRREHSEKRTKTYKHTDEAIIS